MDLKKIYQKYYNIIFVITIFLFLVPIFLNWIWIFRDLTFLQNIFYIDYIISSFIISLGLYYIYFRESGSDNIIKKTLDIGYLIVKIVLIGVGINLGIAIIVLCISAINNSIIYLSFSNTSVILLMFFFVLFVSRLYKEEISF